MTYSAPISPPLVSRDFVESKCAYFIDVQLWPREYLLNSHSWLTNFTAEEMEYAIHLLTAFMYFSGDLTTELLKAAFQRLSSLIVPMTGPYVQAQAQWDHFQQNVILTYVTGEQPSDTDSGHVFARRARQDLGIPEDNIMNPANALASLLSKGHRPVVFVDDFVGSGDQCIKTWNRDVRLPTGQVASFARYSRVRRGQFFYCPLLCTNYGRDRIAQHCQALTVCPAHFLSTRYSALAPDSIIWPDRLRGGAANFLQTSSRRAGIPDDEHVGYHGLALALAFDHGVPDATLPLFYHDKNGWRPLLRRT